MIKLIATDVDGTLVKDGTLLIDPEYMTVVSRLVDQGIHFVVCSGRQFSSEQKLFAPIKDRLLYISDGGTVVRTPEKILKTYPMETALWKSMCRMVHDELPSCDCFAATPDYCLAEDAGSRMFHWLRDSYGFDVREVPDCIEGRQTRTLSNSQSTIQPPVKSFAPQISSRRGIIRQNSLSPVRNGWTATPAASANGPVSHF